MELVGKLTPRSLGWDRNALGTACKAVNPDTGKVLIGRIVGIVAGLRQTVDKETGDVHTGLKGSFRGLSSKNKVVALKDAEGNPIMANGVPQFEDTGEQIVVTSGVCYLPGGIQEMIEGALALAKEGDAKATVNFAIDLYGIPATNKAGYSFKADNIVSAQAADPLAMLLEQAETNSPTSALPAPTPVEPVQPETATAKASRSKTA